MKSIKIRHARSRLYCDIDRYVLIYYAYIDHMYLYDKGTCAFIIKHLLTHAILPATEFKHTTNLYFIFHS